MSSGRLEPEEGFVYLLQSNVEVSAEIDSKIFPHIAPQNASYPFATYTRITGEHMHHMKSAAGLVNVIFQFEVYAKSYADTKRIGTKCRKALDGFSGLIRHDNRTLDVNSIRCESDTDAHVQTTGGDGVGCHRVIQNYRMICDETFSTF